MSVVWNKEALPAIRDFPGNAVMQVEGSGCSTLMLECHA